MAARSHARADIQPERPNFFDRLANIVGIEAAREKNRFAARLDDPPRQRPVMPPSCSAEFLDRKVRVAAVEQYRVNVFGQFRGLIDGMFANYVDDLNEFDVRQSVSDQAVFAAEQFVNDLDRVRPGSMMMIDDAGGRLLGRQKERGDRRRDTRGNAPDLVIRDRPRPGRHRPDQTDRGRTGIYRHGGFAFT